jgi:hypothetical protein
MLNLIAPKLGSRYTTIVAVGNSPVLLAAANPSRKSLVIQSKGSATVYLGGAGVAASGNDEGYSLVQSATFTDLTSSDAWYGICGSTGSVLVIETT